MEEIPGSTPTTLTFDFQNRAHVACILCEDTFNVNDDIQSALKHLLNEHKFVIGSPEEIADFRHYLLYWKKLRVSNLEDYCIIYITNTEKEAKAHSEKFYLLCDKLPEDQQLRKTLKEAKLKYITDQKEKDFQNREFSRRCIYCPSVIEGGISKSFDHLSSEHGFCLGNPGNIVFGAELLDLMEHKLRRLQCLLCEKTFKNHIILREHMRKKQHRSLNPKNKEYDRFYLINYLKPGMPWEEAKKTVFEENKSVLNLKYKEDEESEDDELLWTDWREDASDVPLICLFCSYGTSKKTCDLFHHMQESHNFDFEVLTESLTFYSKVKVVNFIRSQVKNHTCITCLVKFESSEKLLGHAASCDYSTLPQFHLWDLPLFLIPVIESDELLTHLDDNEIEEETSSTASSVQDEVVLPEDLIDLTSILTDMKLREELTRDLEERGSKSERDLCYFLFKCFFCSFAVMGFRGKAICVNHMNSIHNFNYSKVCQEIQSYCRKKLINYIRFMNDCGKCFVCERYYTTKSALEEHRTLEGHCDLPTNTHFHDKRWNESILVNDGFIYAAEDKG